MSSREDAGSDGSELGLGGLLVWLTIFGVALAGLEQLAGWPAQPTLPDPLPSWNAVQVWLPEAPPGSAHCEQPRTGWLPRRFVAQSMPR